MLTCARLVEIWSFGRVTRVWRRWLLVHDDRRLVVSSSTVTRRDLPLPCDVRIQMMSYYLLTVLRQDDGMEVQRIIKELIRNKVRLRGAMNRWRRPRRAGLRVGRRSVSRGPTRAGHDTGLQQQGVR